MITLIKYLLILILLGFFCAILIMETPTGRNIGRWIFGLSFQQLEKDWQKIKGHQSQLKKLDIKSLERRVQRAGFQVGNPVLIRIFKIENKLELWLKKEDKFSLFETYPICAWSGQLGPKLKEGDRQSPEGFYHVSEKQLNPNSKYYRSFNLGYPNAFDRSYNRTGSLLMVHGDCKSVGCYAMTDPLMGEIWHLVTAALRNGQSQFQVQALPFALTQANLLRYRSHKSLAFWQELKIGYDLFEQTHQPPRINVSNQKYHFMAGQ